MLRGEGPEIADWHAVRSLTSSSDVHIEEIILIPQVGAFRVDPIGSAGAGFVIHLRGENLRVFAENGRDVLCALFPLDVLQRRGGCWLDVIRRRGRGKVFQDLLLGDVAKRAAFASQAFERPLVSAVDTE